MTDDSPFMPATEGQPEPENLLVRFLADRYETCPLCGYNLRGLTSTRCPECGQELRLGVSLAEPYLKAWVALLVALLLPAGVGLYASVMLVYILVRVFGSPNLGSLHWSGIPLGMSLVLLHLLACGPLSVAAIVCRRRFLQRRRRSQVAIALAAWAALAGTMAWLLTRLL